MDLNLSGKRVLITGASKGIGLAVACLFAEEGCELILVARDPALLAEAEKTVRAGRQAQVRTISADLSLSEDIARVAGEAGEIDILVNNAGAIPPGDLHQVADDAWRKAWDLKVFGYINLTRALYARLAARRGVVVNVIGVAGESMNPDYIAGSTGNAALMAFTKALGKAAPKDGLRVVGINPGPVETARNELLFRARAKAELGEEARWTEYYGKMPFGRPAAPEEIANAVAFLASPRSAYTSGAILTINGGA